MIIFVFLVSVLLVFLIQYHFDRKKFFKFAENIPEKKPFGVLGHGPYLLGKNDGQKFKWLHETCLEFKSLLKLRLGPAMIWIIVNEPRFIQKVLLSPNCLEKPFFYKFLRLDNGLISAKYDIWKLHRKSLNYSFNLKILQAFIPIFIENSQKLIDDLKVNVTKKNEFDMLSYTTKCALNMICGTSFGIDIKSFALTDDVFHALEKLNQAICVRSSSFMLYSEPIYRMTNYYRDEMKSRKMCYASADLLIKEKRRALTAPEEDINNNDLVKHFNPMNMNNDKDLIKNEEEAPTRKIFIDHVICNDTKFNDIEVRDHVYTIVAAGSETTALQTAHTILLLATNPDIQDKIVDELKEVYYSDEIEITYESLSKLVYLERVIKESLRLCPVVPIIGRETQGNIKLDDFEVPAGITMLINFYSLHRRKDIWGENAEQFNPDHFLPENVEKRHPYSFLPFSGGARNCIGYRYAMISLKILLIYLVKNYKFSTHLKYEDIQFRSDINLKLCTKHWVSIEHRSFSV